MNKIVYHYKNGTYSWDDLKRALPNICWPSYVPSEATLTALGITREVVTVPDVPVVTPTLEELKEQKAADIRAKSDSLIAQVSTGYSQGEVSTFAQQYQGATDIQAGSTTTEEAQFVTSLLTARLGTAPTDEQIAAFASLIVNNYEAAKAATISIVGTQQRLELAIRACTTKDEVAAVAWPTAEQ